MNFDIISLVIGAVVGLITMFFGKKSVAGNAQKEIDAANAKADLTIKEAEKTAARKLEDAKSKAELIVEKAEQKNESIKQKKIQEARSKFSKLKSDYESYKSEHKVEMKEREVQVVGKEKDLQIKIDQFAAKEETIKAATEAMSIEKNTIEEAKANANKEAKKIVIQAIQRSCAEYTIENTVSVFNLESDDIKGQIIGREGRNIRALEAATGAEIVVDDTPEAIIISSFDPIRREVCRLSLKRLVADGRIHPAKIEEVVEKTRKQLEERIVEIGERTVIDLDIHGLHPYLVRMVGRMRFRSSYGQNLLKHSIETATLCATMSAELGMSPKQIKMAKRAGLLHDIGKVAEEESELSHALIGMEMCKKHNEHAVVQNAVGAHHDEMEMNNIISPIVQACDAISGARPGARREILESYLKRIGELEELAMNHEGVEKAYAIQAGRELRVIVESEKVSDQYADDLAFMISQKIEQEMQYPGQVKVTVIREKRATAVAR